MFKITPIRATHDFAPPANWDHEKDGHCGSLWVRVGLLGERKLRTFTSAWKPTAEELRALNAGAAVEVEIVGTQPPMAVEVVPEYGTQDRQTVEVEKASITINEDAHGFGCDEHGVATP